REDRTDVAAEVDRRAGRIGGDALRRRERESSDDEGKKAGGAPVSQGLEHQGIRDGRQVGSSAGRLRVRSELESRSVAHHPPSLRARQALPREKNPPRRTQRREVAPRRHGGTEEETRGRRENSLRGTQSTATGYG